MSDSNNSTVQRNMACCDKTLPRNTWLIIWRVVNLLLMVFFLAATAVQFNDPDAYIWIPIYVIPAILCLTIVIRPYATDHWVWQWVSLIHLVLCGGYTVFTVVQLEREIVERQSKPEEELKGFMEFELGRELVGLIIVVIYLVSYKYSPIAQKCRSGCAAGARERAVSQSLENLTSVHYDYMRNSTQTMTTNGSTEPNVSGNHESTVKY